MKPSDSLRYVCANYQLKW